MPVVCNEDAVVAVRPPINLQLQRRLQASQAQQGVAVLRSPKECYSGSLHKLFDWVVKKTHT